MPDEPTDNRESGKRYIEFRGAPQDPTNAEIGAFLEVLTSIAKRLSVRESEDTEHDASGSDLHTGIQ